MGEGDADFLFKKVTMNAHETCIVDPINLDKTVNSTIEMETNITPAQNPPSETEDEPLSPSQLNLEGFFVVEPELERQKRLEFGVSEPEVCRSRANPPKRKLHQYKDPVYDKDDEAAPEKRQKIMDNEDLLQDEKILDAVDSPSLRLVGEDEGILDENDLNLSPRSENMESHNEEEPVERELIPKFLDVRRPSRGSPADSDKSDSIVVLSDSDEAPEQYEKDSEEDYDSQNFAEDYGEDLGDEEADEEEEEDEIGLIDEVQGSSRGIRLVEDERVDEEDKFNGESEEESYAREDEDEDAPNTSGESKGQVLTDTDAASAENPDEYDEEQGGYTDEDEDNDVTSQDRKFYEYPSDAEHEEYEDSEEEHDEDAVPDKAESDSDSDIICLD